MLGALVLCSPREHVFYCTLLAPRCTCVNEWQTCVKQVRSSALWFRRDLVQLIAETCWGFNTDWPMPIGTHVSCGGPTRSGQSMWTELSFPGQTCQSLWPFHNSSGIRGSNLICQIIDCQGSCDLCCYDLGPKVGLVVRKRLASLGIESYEARWSSGSKSISEVKGYSDWNYNGFAPPPLATLALSGPEEALKSVRNILEGISQF